MAGISVVVIIVLVVVATTGLYITYFPSIESTEKPSMEKQTPSEAGLGKLCSNSEECKNFCLNNMGHCISYCEQNLDNLICQKLLAPQIFPQSQSEPQSSGIEEPKKSCVNNPSPLFTAQFTDITKIAEVSQIGSNAFFNPGSQARSYIAVKKGEMTPVYAPVNATLTRIYYSNKNYPGGVRPEYRLDFQVSCEVSFAYDHVITIVDKLKEQAPQTPAEGRNDGAEVSIPVKAGELLAYTSGTIQAGTWDFLFLNTGREAPHINPARWSSDHSKYADCPYDYFTDNLKKQ